MKKRRWIIGVMALALGVAGTLVVCVLYREQVRAEIGTLRLMVSVERRLLSEKHLPEPPNYTYFPQWNVGKHQVLASGAESQYFAAGAVQTERGDALQI